MARRLHSSDEGCGERCTRSTAAVYTHLCPGIRQHRLRTPGKSGCPHRRRSPLACSLGHRPDHILHPSRAVGCDTLTPRLVNDGAIRIDRTRSAALGAKQIGSGPSSSQPDYRAHRTVGSDHSRRVNWRTALDLGAWPPNPRGCNRSSGGHVPPVQDCSQRIDRPHSEYPRAFLISHSRGRVEYSITDCGLITTDIPIWVAFHTSTSNTLLAVSTDLYAIKIPSTPDTFTEDSTTDRSRAISITALLSHGSHSKHTPLKQY